MSDKSPGGFLNPNFKKNQKASDHYDVQELFDLIIAGDIAAVSRAITLIESDKSEHLSLAAELIKKVLPVSGTSTRIGITGIPGAGKSTFIESFGQELLKTSSCKIAILTIDPSSTISKGSILGDKTRMESLSKEARVFIRPSPSSGNLGGVAKATKEAMLICEAAGYDYIIIETVGVGQSEIETYYLVDFFILLLIPGGGDELQGIKRGIMEMADLILVNKAEGANASKAKLAAKELESALHYFPANKYHHHASVKTISAIENIGIDSVKKYITDSVKKWKENTSFELKRNDQNEYWLEENVLRIFKHQLIQNKDWSNQLEIYKQKIANNEIHPFDAANELVQLILKK